MTGVALTFDDGPDPEITPQLLDLLAELGVVPRSSRSRRAPRRTRS